MLRDVRSKVVAYVASHRAEVRFLCFLLALAAVVSSASGIEDLIHGLLDGSSAASIDAQAAA